MTTLCRKSSRPAQRSPVRQRIRSSGSFRIFVRSIRIGRSGSG
nr:MAG TPA: hypothetical protein [Caudoviricetes sp.]